MLEHLVDCVGKLAIAFIVVRFVWFCVSNFYVYYLPRNDAKRMRSYGQWAVITGSTDGLGREYALRLAAYGINIVLIARNPETLKRMAEEIAQLQSGAQTRIITVDFCNLDIYDKIEREIADLDVGILINNVGMQDFNEHKPRLGEKTLSGLIDVISVNMVSVTAMSSIVLPKMKSNKRGLVVNISSMSSLLPLPFLPIYCSSKSFVSSLSESMRLEYAEYGVEVQTAVPYFIITKLSRFRKSTFFIRTLDLFIAAHLKTLGVASNTHGCIPHEIMGCVVRTIISLPIRDAFCLSTMNGVRRRALALKKQ